MYTNSDWVEEPWWCLWPTAALQARAHGPEAMGCHPCGAYALQVLQLVAYDGNLLPRITRSRVLQLVAYDGNLLPRTPQLNRSPTSAFD